MILSDFVPYRTLMANTLKTMYSINKYEREAKWLFLSIKNVTDLDKSQRYEYNGAGETVQGFRQFAFYVANFSSVIGTA